MMTITLAPEQQTWLEAEVAAGHYVSVEEAVRLAVAELMIPIDTTDLILGEAVILTRRALPLLGARELMPSRSFMKLTRGSDNVALGSCDPRAAGTHRLLSKSLTFLRMSQDRASPVAMKAKSSGGRRRASFQSRRPF
jgi:hypothetical protein